MTDRPRVLNAPGIQWRKRVKGWEATWRARPDLISKGWRPKSKLLWVGFDLSSTAEDMIRDQCQSLQREMLVFGRGSLPQIVTFDGTLSALVNCYRSDPDSPYQKLRTATRQNYNSRLNKLIENERGAIKIRDIRSRQVTRWHEEWKGPEGNYISGASDMVNQLRVVVGFGATLLEDDDCLHLSTLLSKMKFPGHRTRQEAITAEQAGAICAAAHVAGKPSLALAQAFQFECTFRQKDVIGEWVPLSAREGIGLIDGNEKWLRGIRWNEIDDNLILKHVTSKKLKEIVIDLKLAPMVMEELAFLAPGLIDPITRKVNRSLLPASGPIIICEKTLQPWRAHNFRRGWRMLARACGISDKIKNMDSRAGAITEAEIAGASYEQIRHAATHSQVSQTAAYARGRTQATADVMRKRGAHRMNKPGTDRAENE
jgi:hypothetical protein